MARPPALPARLEREAAALRDALAGYPARAPIGEAAYILLPLQYAWELHADYLRKRAPRTPGQVEAVLVGMNPGPWGMGQTGVPFGSPRWVRDFLGVEGDLDRAGLREHPARPVRGLDSRREEASGDRLWGGIQACFGTADAFFARFFVSNYCPLLFQSASGTNLTPDKLPAAAMADCFAACDAHLRATLEAIQPRTVIGVGAWATKQARRIVKAAGLGVAVGTVLHPSPASPAANAGWLGLARKQLADLGHPWPEPKRNP